MAARSSTAPPPLTRDRLIHFFHRFSSLISQPGSADFYSWFTDFVMSPSSTSLIPVVTSFSSHFSSAVRARIAEAVKGKQEAISVTTAVQEEILVEMGIDPSLGLSFLRNVSDVYANDMDLMVQFYGFVAKEELACDEAELSSNAFSEKMNTQQKMQNQQLEMLKDMRRYSPAVQSAILETLHRQMECSHFDKCPAVLTSEQIQEIAGRKVAPAETSYRGLMCIALVCFRSLIMMHTFFFAKWRWFMDLCCSLPNLTKSTIPPLLMR